MILKDSGARRNFGSQYTAQRIGMPIKAIGEDYETEALEEHKA